jgi:hypothetical protein
MQAFLALLDWSAEHKMRNTAYSVGLILNPRFDGDRESWAAPVITAYVTRREGYSQTPVAEPAALRIL